MFNVRFVLAAVAVVMLAGPAASQSKTPIEQFRDWGTFKGETSNGRVCYALSEPQSMEPQGVRRGDVLLYVTIRPDQGIRNEVSVVTGYPYREGSRATIEIGSETFGLRTLDDGAWIEDLGEEERLIRAMRAGTTMIVRGTSQRGTDTIDRYSLLGISAALDRIARECA